MSECMLQETGNRGILCIILLGVCLSMSFFSPVFAEEGNPSPTKSTAFEENEGETHTFPLGVQGPKNTSSLEGNILSSSSSSSSSDKNSDLQWVMVIFAVLVVVGSFSSKRPSEKKPLRVRRTETVETEE